jgi:hypothetical protein
MPGANSHPAPESRCQNRSLWPHPETEGLPGWRFWTWARASALLYEAFFIDERHNDRRRGRQLTAREEPQVVGFQFDQVEDGDAGEEEQYHEEDGTQCQGHRIDGK